LSGNGQERGVLAALRKTQAVVILDFVPLEVKRAARVVCSRQASHSEGGQVFNGIADTSGRFASFERRFWKLDGSFMLPEMRHFGEMEIGFISEQDSRSTGLYDDPPTVSVELNEPVNCPAIGCSFDASSGEVADTVRLRGFGADGSVLIDETISNNRAAHVQTTGGADGVMRVEVNVIRSVLPHRRARIAEVFLGRVLRLDGDDIFSLKMISEADPSGVGMPVNQLRLSIANKGRFDYLDENSVAQLMAKRQAFEYRHGVQEADGSVNWRGCGLFYLESFTVNERRVDFVANGRAHELSATTFYNSAIATMTLGDLIRRVADEIGFNVAIAQGFFRTPRVPAFLGNVSHREALSMLAQVSCCLLTEDRQGGLRFIDLLASRKARSGMDFDSIYELPKVERGQYYNGISLREITYGIAPEERLVHKNVSVSGGYDFEIHFPRPYVDRGRIQLPWGFSLDWVEFHAMYVKGRVTGHGNCLIEVFGRPAVFMPQDNFYPAPWMGKDERPLPYNVDLPMFINNVCGDYRNFRQWFLNRKFELMRRRLRTQVHWRQDFGVEVGDKVRVQIDYGGQELRGHVVRQEIAFDGGVMSGSTGVVG